jgi:ribosomal protein L24
MTHHVCFQPPQEDAVVVVAGKEKNNDGQIKK